MEDNNLKHLLKLLIKKWRNSEKKWEKNEKSWQKTERQWLREEECLNIKSAVQHTKFQWAKAEVKWLKAEGKFQARDKLWSHMETKLDNPTEGVLMYADLLEFESQYNIRRRHWENRKSQWLQKQAWFLGRKKLEEMIFSFEQEKKECEARENTWRDLERDLRQKLEAAEEQLGEWIKKEQDWFEKEETFKTNEKSAQEEKTRQVEDLQSQQKTFSTSVKPATPQTGNSDAQEDLPKMVIAKPQNKTLTDGDGHKSETAAKKNKMKRRRCRFWRLFGRSSSKTDQE